MTVRNLNVLNKYVLDWLAYKIKTAANTQSKHTTWLIAVFYKVHASNYHGVLAGILSLYSLSNRYSHHQMWQIIEMGYEFGILRSLYNLKGQLWYWDTCQIQNETIIMALHIAASRFDEICQDVLVA